MKPDTAIDRVKRDLHDVVDCMHADLNRIEILTAALSAFSRPVPDYEPNFHHLRHLTLDAQELGN
jgi:hypothetical protein